MRLIDADALKNWIDCGHLRNPTELCFSELDVVQILDKQPTFDAVPMEYHEECLLNNVHKRIEAEKALKKAFRHSYWIHDINNLYGCARCGNRETMGHKKKKNYCPNCGAKMDLEEDNRK